MQKILLVAAVATLLSACSSGKGGSSGAVSTSNPVHSVIVSPPTTATNVTGHIMSVGPNNRTSAITTSAQSKDVNVVMVDGKPITFIPEGITTGSLNLTGNKTRIGSGDNLKYSRYGYMHDGNNSTPHLFAQGVATPTAQVPKQGTATYKGEAVHHKFGVNRVRPEISRPTATLYVNYGNKTFNGHIGSEQIKVAELSGTINGNVLSGTSTKGVTTHAQFYGPNAEEIAGAYRDNNGGNSGVFGVTKTK